MSDDSAAMFTPPRRKPRRRFPVLPAILVAITAVVVAGFGAKAWLDKNERVAHAQARAIGAAYFKNLASDAEHYQANFDNLAFEPPHVGMDFSFNREQLQRMRKRMASYRALCDQREAEARAALQALKVRPGVKRRYLAEAGRTMADKRAQIERWLTAQEGIMTESSAMWDLLESHRGQWHVARWAGLDTIGIDSSALFPAYARHAEALQRYERSEGEARSLMAAPEMWVSAPP